MKHEFIEQEVAKNKVKFGRWGSTKKRDSAEKEKLFHEMPPKNHVESVQHGNALENTGNYPVGTDDCFNVGISGGCGAGCFVYKKGLCSDPPL